MCIIFNKIGILAYGSLIVDPGPELKDIIRKRIKVETPFTIEFKRKSKTRGDAPTLIPVEYGGRHVKGTLLVLDNKITVEEAKSMLWRRERRKENSGECYVEPLFQDKKSIRIKALRKFSGVETVLYTHIEQNIEEPVTPKILADLAIKSILGTAGEEKLDGVRYLKDIIDSGIETDFSFEYMEEILKSTNTKSLAEAILILDKRRHDKT